MFLHLIELLLLLELLHPFPVGAAKLVQASQAVEDGAPNAELGVHRERNAFGRIEFPDCV
jgi:hypothetical protein